jgi:hypothetical protein
MEKKGDIINQIAIISDLIEKANFERVSSTIIFELKDDVFIETFNYFRDKHGNKVRRPDITFTIVVGEVNIVFNKSSV